MRPNEHQSRLELRRAPRLVAGPNYSLARQLARQLEQPQTAHWVWGSLAHPGPLPGMLKFVAFEGAVVQPFVRLPVRLHSLAHCSTGE